MTEFVGSKAKSQTARGQMQDQTPSSTREKTLPIIPAVAPKQVAVPSGDWQTRPVSSAQAAPTYPGMASAPQHAFPGKSSPVRPPVKR